MKLRSFQQKKIMKIGAFLDKISVNKHLMYTCIYIYNVLRYSYLGTALPRHPASLLTISSAAGQSSLPAICFMEFPLHIDVICHAVEGSNVPAYAVGDKRC